LADVNAKERHPPADHREPEAREKKPDAGQPGTTRLESFSDNVMSIIITVMVLTIQIPANAMDHGFVDGLVRPFGPRLGAYAFSFVMVGIFWVNHHQLLPTAPKSTPALIWWNNNALFWVSLTPIVTQYVGVRPMQAVPVAMYAAVQVAVSVSFVLLRHHIAGQRRDHRAMVGHYKRILLRSSLAGAANLAAIGLAFVSVWAAFVALIIGPVLFFMPPLLPRGAVVDG